MKVQPLDPPREFEVGRRGERLRHSADVELEGNEQVTFKTPSGTELDVVRKSWGYYATPSMNSRLRDHGLRAVLTVGLAQRMYLLLVEGGREEEFDEYLQAEGMRVVAWLDDDAAVTDAVELLEKGLA